MAARTCNHKKMKTMNTGAILSILAKHGAMSRIGLTKALKLDGTTVTHLVRELLAAGLVETKGFSQKAMGRPKQLLQLKPDGRQAVGLQIEPHKISGALVNLQGQIKAYETSNNWKRRCWENYFSRVNRSGICGCGPSGSRS